MSADEKAETVEGEFRTHVRVRSDVWYGNRLIELMAQGEPGMRGGKPRQVQVLLTREQAVDLIAVLAHAAGDVGPSGGES